MNTQNAPIHIHLWNREFWLMAIANLLLSLSATILIPTLPLWMQYVEGLSAQETGWAMGAFAIGLFMPGPFCSYLVQHYRRNMVCIWAVIMLALTITVPYYVHGMDAWTVVLLRLLQGVAFGLAQMVLASTLTIETCESFLRTEANHSATWFGRFALSLGPMLGLLLYPQSGYGAIALVSVGSLAVTILLVLMVHFPFRVPAGRVRVLSLDRFFLSSSLPLYLNLMFVTVGLGLLLSLQLTPDFYGLLMIGFLLALLAQRFVFSDADLKSEVVSGLLLMLASVLILLFQPVSPLLSPLLGLGLGLTGSRFLLFLIKLSRHCQRGTAQSTFLLGWESGLAIGLGLGYTLFEDQRSALLMVALILYAAALLLYATYTHTWFMNHKNR